MRIYLDTCCYNRPFDECVQSKVQMEAIAVKAIVNFCKYFEYDIVGSHAVTEEIKKIRDGKRLKNVQKFYTDAVNKHSNMSDDIDNRVQELKTHGLTGLDHYHLAFAEAAGVNFLLTTDDRFIKKCERLNSTVKVVNPLNFLPEVMVWAL